jgi:hypothetical protein
LEGQEFANDHDLLFLETSAKDGMNCNSSMQLLLQGTLSLVDLTHEGRDPQQKCTQGEISRFGQTYQARKVNKKRP